MAPPPPPPPLPKRRPTVLVTDARDQQPAPRSALQRRTTTPTISNLRSSNPNPNAPQQTAPSRVRFVSVDQVLRNTSEIPSGQTRSNPLSHLHRARNPSIPSSSRTGPVDPRRAVDQSRVLPLRSSKVSEKLVFLPEAPSEPRQPRWDYVDEEDEGPLRDDEETESPEEADEQPPLPPKKSYAERLPKARRAEKFARVTAYCTADGYRLAAASKFLKDHHNARTKLYDECLYVAYHLPILPGGGGYRVKSSPALKSPGGKNVLDAEIERCEAQNYHEGYFAEFGERRYSADGDAEGEGEGEPDVKTPVDERMDNAPDNANHDIDDDQTQSAAAENTSETTPLNPSTNDDINIDGDVDVDTTGTTTDTVSNTNEPLSPLQSPPPLLLQSPPTTPMKLPAQMDIAEMFIFSYGVVVFWNFTEHQEKDILADLTFAGDRGAVKLITGPLGEDDFESEEFNFEYSSKTRSPRIYNDMITLHSPNLLIKLTISHALAQSTKLCRFEERMSLTMSSVHHIPRTLALTGNLGLSRSDVIKLSGRLFRLRVDVNLSSNVLDVPEFFWDEPQLHPLYNAVREYLEIHQRVAVLNTRCGVFLDLAEILTDGIADKNMSRITWIIICLILLSIVVTVAEVTIRFSILRAKAGGREPGFSRVC
ncbi:DUF155-domain-containing protein [Ascodesmis nigricans]|uniref:DUF155-domain-containing protein n=1 Tax=Ascodesmis nigricans TaxID=341454 RepID=A0A4V3SHV0_9PEZI|nr:DUF155-domain-containing protein [Ascodesmis nigricans]